MATARCAACMTGTGEVIGGRHGAARRIGAMPLVSIGDADLHVEQSGPPDAAPLLLVAGLGGKGSFWSAQVPALSQRFRVITHDHRGTGGSSRSTIVYSATQMADDVIRLMDALGIARAHLCGHSTGGAVGQHVALRHPERLGRLVMSGSWCGPDALFVETFRLRRQVLITCGPQAYYMLGSLLAQPAEITRGQFRSLEQYLGPRMADFPGLEIELSRLSAVMSHDLRSDVGRIAAPTLVLGAADDQLTPPGFQRELAERIPGAELRVFDDGGHFFPITRAAPYAAEVLRFLGAGRKGAGA
jgi:aminoacrylate hydrolase